MVLPQPDGPTTHRKSCGVMATSICCSASTAPSPSPKRLDTPANITFARARRSGASSFMGAMDRALPATVPAATVAQTIFARNVESTNGAKLGGMDLTWSAAFRNSAWSFNVFRTPVSLAPGIPIHVFDASSLGVRL